MGVKIKIFVNDQSKAFECPGCDMTHSFDGRWKWNGSLVSPTFTPSLLCRFPHKGNEHVCHSFITDGKIRFLNDCTHSLKGQTVDLPDWDGVQIKE